jgi:hypothetical protein
MNSKRRTREVETFEYLQTVVVRTLRAAGRRVADADEPELAELYRMREELDDAIAVAIAGQRKRQSWRQIGESLGGITGQAASQKWGARVAAVEAENL